MDKCKSCLGFGFWPWSHIAPVGPIDAEDGVPTLECPECGANPNPIDSNNKEYQKRSKILQKIYGDDLLRFGDADTPDELNRIWKKVNKRGKEYGLE